MSSKLINGVKYIYVYERAIYVIMKWKIGVEARQEIKKKYFPAIFVV